jgi:hypothetical protein
MQKRGCTSPQRGNEIRGTRLVPTIKMKNPDYNGLPLQHEKRNSCRLVEEQKVQLTCNGKGQVRYCMRQKSQHPSQTPLHLRFHSYDGHVSCPLSVPQDHFWKYS